MLGIGRLSALFAVSVALLWLGSAGAQAAGNPDRQPLPTPPTLTGPMCGDRLGTITAEVTLMKEYGKTFNLPDGTVKLQVNGNATTLVTGNGKALTFNSSGPAQVYFHPDNSVTEVGEGHLFYIGANLLGLWVYTGLVVIDASGNIVSSSGHVTDVCALLAA